MNPRELAMADRLASDLLRPVFQTTGKFYALVAALVGIVVCGLARGVTRCTTGSVLPGTTGRFLGFHETNFVFWIGISHAGTLISAILRIVNATWRRPVTRCAEVITAFALMIGAMFPDHPSWPTVARILSDSLSQRAMAFGRTIDRLWSGTSLRSTRI